MACLNIRLQSQIQKFSGSSEEGSPTRADELGAKGDGRAGAGSALTDKGTVLQHLDKTS